MNKKRVILAAVVLGLTILIVTVLVLRWTNGMQDTVDQGRGVWQDWLRNRLSP